MPGDDTSLHTKIIGCTKSQLIYIFIWLQVVTQNWMENIHLQLHYIEVFHRIHTQITIKIIIIAKFLTYAT